MLVDVVFMNQIPITSTLYGNSDRNTTHFTHVGVQISTVAEQERTSVELVYGVGRPLGLRARLYLAGHQRISLLMGRVVHGFCYSGSEIHF